MGNRTGAARAGDAREDFRLTSSIAGWADFHRGCHRDDLPGTWDRLDKIAERGSIRPGLRYVKPVPGTNFIGAAPNLALFTRV